MLSVHNLSKQFGDLCALDALSFSAHDGQITGLLGPNGAGKTTCLRLLYGLLQADSGNAKVDDINVALEPIRARSSLGIFPDKFGLYNRLTSREQIEFFAGLHGLKGRVRNEAVAAVIAELKIEDIADRRSEGFSQGERMKVTLAQALVHRPRNLILDEPTRGLDVMSTRLMRDHLRALRDRGHCILFASHQMQEVAALCDRVIILAKGQLAAEGTPAELCRLAGVTELEDAFVKIIGSDEGIAA
jgi:sodium transport system ATP-binding protein